MQIYHAPHVGAGKRRRCAVHCYAKEALAPAAAAAAAAGAGPTAAAGGVRTLPHPATDKTTARISVPVIPERDHGDLDDSASDYSDPSSTGGGTQDTLASVPTENRLASLMTAGVMATTASSNSGNAAGGARHALAAVGTPGDKTNGRFSRAVTQSRVASTASSVAAPILPPRQATSVTGGHGNDSETSSSDSERCVPA